MTESPEPQQITIMKRLVEMSAERSQMSAERTFMNAERTLSVWIRTALALMIFGIAIARFGLLLRQMPLPQSRGDLSANDLSSWGGSMLIALGVL
ncbi:MAG: YidH family protein, partial [Steroidobacteraceae bacterium]